MMIGLCFKLRNQHLISKDPVQHFPWTPWAPKQTPCGDLLGLYITKRGPRDHHSLLCGWLEFMQKSQEQHPNLGNGLLILLSSWDSSNHFWWPAVEEDKRLHVIVLWSALTTHSQLSLVPHRPGPCCMVDHVWYSGVPSVDNLLLQFTSYQTFIWRPTVRLKSCSMDRSHGLSMLISPVTGVSSPASLSGKWTHCYLGATTRWVSPVVP